MPASMHTGIHKNQTLSAGKLVRSFKEKSENFALYSSTVLMYAYILLTKCVVKIAGYWPSLFFCVLMDREEVEVHKLAKKERGQYPAILTEQTWSIKDLLFGFRGNFSCGIQRVVPSGQDGFILPARVANHIARFCSSCPLAELAI